MLPGADQDDGQKRDRHGVPPAQSEGGGFMIEPDRNADHHREVKVDPDKVIDVGDVVGPPQVLEHLFEPGIPEGFGLSLHGGGHVRSSYPFLEQPTYFTQSSYIYKLAMK